MRLLRRWCVGLVLPAAISQPLAAQVRPESRLIFSIFGGVVRPGGLWTLDKQPLLVLFGTPRYDTLRLRRKLTTGLTAGLSATFFRSANFGLSGEIVYVALRIDDDCEMTFTHLDVQLRNTQLCDDITQRTRTASTVGFYFGAAYRFTTRSAVTPYVRLQGGFAVRSSSLIEMTGRFIDEQPDGTQTVNLRSVLLEDSRISVDPGLAGAAGIMFAVAPGYNVRLEVRDHLLVVDRPTAAADQLGSVETESFLTFAPALVIGIDIVLERRRGRRY